MPEKAEQAAREAVNPKINDAYEELQSFCAEVNKEGARYSEKLKDMIKKNSGLETHYYSEAQRLAVVKASDYSYNQFMTDFREGAQNLTEATFDHSSAKTANLGYTSSDFHMAGTAAMDRTEFQKVLSSTVQDLKVEHARNMNIMDSVKQLQRWGVQFNSDIQATVILNLCINKNKCPSERDAYQQNPTPENRDRLIMKGAKKLGIEGSFFMTDGPTPENTNKLLDDIQVSDYQKQTCQVALSSLRGAVAAQKSLTYVHRELSLAGVGDPSDLLAKMLGEDTLPVDQMINEKDMNTGLSPTLKLNLDSDLQFKLRNCHNSLVLASTMDYRPALKSSVFLKNILRCLGWEL